MGWQGWVHVLLLLVIGALGASSVIVKKKPEAKELMDKLAKYSGYAGALALLWGLYNLVFSVIFELRLLSFGLFGIVFWVTILAIVLVYIGLGGIFGYGLIAAYMSEEQKAKAAPLRQKLVGYQIPLGWVAIILAIWLPVFFYVVGPMLIPGA